jgi:hypothetical protein
MLIDNLTEFLLHVWNYVLAWRKHPSREAPAVHLGYKTNWTLSTRVHKACETFVFVRTLHQRILGIGASWPSAHLGRIFHRSQARRDSTLGTVDSLVSSSPQIQSRSLPWRDIDCTRCHREPLAPNESSVSLMTTTSMQHWQCYRHACHCIGLLLSSFPAWSGQSGTTFLAVIQSAYWTIDQYQATRATIDACCGAQ